MVELSKRERDVLDYIEESKEQQIEDLKEIVKTKPINPPGHEEPAAEWVRSRLQELDFDIEEHTKVEGRPNLVARLPGTGDTTENTTLLSNAHLDVVPVRNPDAWPCDPFDPEIINGRMYGRGTVDHKSPLIAMLTAVEAIQENDIDLDGNLIFIFDSDEEQGGENGMKYVMDNAEIEADMGIYAVTQSLTDEAVEYHPQFGKDNIVRANCGSQVFQITVKGHLVHPKAPDESIGAEARLSRLLPHIQSYCDSVREIDDPLVGSPRADISKLESTGRGDRPSSEVTVNVRRYYTPNENPEETYSEFKSFIEDIASKEDLSNEVNVNEVKNVSNIVVPEDHELVQAAIRSAEIVRNRKPRVTGTPSQTGIAWIVEKLQLPMILYGFGNVDLHHAEPEWIEPKDLIDTSKAYSLTYMDLLS